MRSSKSISVAALTVWLSAVVTAFAAGPRAGQNGPQVSAGEDSARAQALGARADAASAQTLGSPTSSPGLRQGGDTCATATPFSGLPFNTTGTTVGYVDNYEEVCPWDNPGSPDVVYVYTPAADQCVDLSLCNGSGYDTKLYVYENDCPGALFDCNDDDPSCNNEFQSRLLNLELIGGNTYYIVVDGWDGDMGNYVLDVTRCAGPCLTCDAGKTPEGEPQCSDGYEDTHNAGCNATNPLPADFQTIACGDQICGTSGTFVTGGDARDTDWYQVVLDQPETIQWTVTADFPLLIFIVDGTPGCTDLIVVDDGTAERCETASLTASVAAGTYWLWVGPQEFTGVPCGAEYTAELVCGVVCGDGDCAPEEDCTSCAEDCGPCSCPDATIRVEIMTDDYPSETNWTVEDTTSGDTVVSRGPLLSPNSLSSENVCVDAAGCYDFTIFDLFGDGICCEFGNGYYNVYFEDTLVGSGGEFVSSETISRIGGCTGPGPSGACCSPLGACIDDIPEVDCAAAGGKWSRWATCGANPTLPPAVCSTGCTFNNGGPLDDFGAPASQYAPDIPFGAGAADDFMLLDASPGNFCRIDQVTVWTTHWNGPASPDFYQGVYVTIYANSETNGPGGQSEDDGTHTEYFAGGVVYSKFVRLADVTATPENPTCLTDMWRIDVTLGAGPELEKNVTYWLEVQPIMPFETAGQSALIMADTNHGRRAQQIFDLAGLPLWREIAGNAGDCPNAPSSGSRRDIAFILSGEKVESARLVSNAPACNDTLPRYQNNVIRLTFGGDITAPSAGQVPIQEALDNGNFGVDDHSGSFTFTVEDDGGGNPRILKIAENGDQLANGEWDSFRNTGGWGGVAAFEVKFPVVFGDADNDGTTDSLDVTDIWGNRGTGAPDDSRYDIDGNGSVGALDVSDAWGNRGSTAPGEPTMHACP